MTENEPLRLVLTKSYRNRSGNYNVLPYDYDQYHPNMASTHVFHIEIGGLTISERCFTLEKLENKWKAKGKGMIDLTKTNEVNRLIDEERVIEFLKLMKHNEYNIVD